MRVKLIAVVFLISVTYTGCSHVQVVKTGSTASTSLPPTNPMDVVIYRSSKPSWQYDEIGVVTVSDIADMKLIYGKIRDEAAKKGADAVVEFKLDSTIITVPVIQTHSGPNGAVYTTTTTQTQVHYMASGTLIHNKESK